MKTLLTCDEMRSTSEGENVSGRGRRSPRALMISRARATLKAGDPFLGSTKVWMGVVMLEQIWMDRKEGGRKEVDGGRTQLWSELTFPPSVRQTVTNESKSISVQPF